MTMKLWSAIALAVIIVLGSAAFGMWLGMVTPGSAP